MNNIYEPHLMRIGEILDETPDIKTFRLTFDDSTVAENFDFKAGQFGLFSVFGEGESTFCIASPPTRMDFIECSVKKVGKVTTALHDLDVNEVVGFRGPYGNWFPLEAMRDRNLVFVGGGIGLAPLRSLILNCLDTRADYKDVTIIYGARTEADLVFKNELAEWEKMDGVKTILTVDPGGANADWKGKIGFVPTILAEVNPKSDNTVVITCGPPVMIKFVYFELTRMGFQPEQVITTLENKMKCGLGICGRCNIGPTYVCTGGPVFDFSKIKELPDEY